MMGERRPGGNPRRAGAAAVLWLACSAQFMTVLDVSVVNVALPAMQTSLGFDAVGLQWVVSAYALAFAGFLLLGGRLADAYGRRRVFAWGLGLFTAASLAGGLAATPGMLIAMRAVQGVGAAVLAPATLTILTTAFPEGPARVRALAIWTAVSSTGGAAGNVLGGVLTDAVSWRWILLVNVPVGAAALAAGPRLLPPEPPGAGSRRLDVPGAALATVGMTALVWGLTQGGEEGWGRLATLTPLATGAMALAAFAVTQVRFAAVPLVPPALVRTRAIWLGNVAMLLAGACFIPMWYFLSLYMQQVLGYGALATGVAFLPHTLVGVVAARLSPAVMRRIGPRPLIALAATMAAAGFLWQSGVGPTSGYADGLLGPAVVMSAGMGLLITPITTTVTSGVPECDAGSASGLMNTARQLGGALGLAALVTLAATHDHGSTPDYPAAFAAMAAGCAGVAVLACALPGGPRPAGRARAVRGRAVRGRAQRRS